MQTLILDFSKWRCGGNSGGPFSKPENILGEGQTSLLNEEGYMCCLGQFSLQLEKNLSKDFIQKKAEPSECKIEIPFLTYFREDPEDENAVFIADTELSMDAMHINDSTFTTPKEKIKELKALFKEYDLEIEVINKP